VGARKRTTATTPETYWNAASFSGRRTLVAVSAITTRAMQIHVTCLVNRSEPRSASSRAIITSPIPERARMMLNRVWSALGIRTRIQM